MAVRRLQSRGTLPGRSPPTTVARASHSLTRSERCCSGEPFGISRLARNSPPGSRSCNPTILASGQFRRRGLPSLSRRTGNTSPKEKMASFVCTRSSLGKQGKAGKQGRGDIAPIENPCVGDPLQTGGELGPATVTRLTAPQVTHCVVPHSHFASPSRVWPSIKRISSPAPAIRERARIQQRCLSQGRRRG